MLSRIGRLHRFLLHGKSASHGHYLFRLLWIGCLSISIPVILGCIAFYQYSLDSTTRQIFEEHKSAVTQTKDRAERILQGIEQESLRLSLDPLISDFSSRRDSPLIWHLDQLNQIKLAKNADSFIEDIYFYNTQESTVLTNRLGVIQKDSYPYQHEMDRMLSMQSGSQWLYQQGESQQGFIAFVRKFPIIGDGNPQGILVLEIDASLISGFLQADTAIMVNGPEMVLVHYPNLGSMSAEEKSIFLRQFENSGGLQQIRASDPEMGSFAAKDADGDPVHYVHVKSVYGRTYVSMIPEQLIDDRLHWLRVTTLLVLVFLITIGVLLTYFSTKKAYSPIEQLIRDTRLLAADRIQSNGNEFDYIRSCLTYLSTETQKLSQYMNKAQPTLRERCLHQLVSGDYTRSDALLQECEAYGITIESTYCVLVVEIENVYNERRFLPGDKPIIAFALTNVIQELLEEHALLSGYVFPYQGRAVALLQWTSDSEQTGLPQSVSEFALSVNEALKNYLSFDASVGIGRCYSHLADIPVSYKEAEIALQYRIYRDAASVLYIEDLENARKQATFRYPRELEGAIVDLLINGQMELAEQSLVQFMDAVKQSQSYTFIYQSYRVLLSSIITSLEKQGGSILDILEYNLFGQLESKQTSREVYDWFAKSLLPLYAKLTEDYRHAVGKSAVQKVSDYIREHSKEDLSLVQCAEMIGMSPSHLSRQFKKEMGVNYLEFVIECKVGEAKKLLLETDLSVSEIADTIGYSERNLIRIFHRHTKMNPGLYRAVHR